MTFGSIRPYPVPNLIRLINAEPHKPSKCHCEYCSSDEYPEWLAIVVQLLDVHPEDGRGEVQGDVDKRKYGNCNRLIFTY